MMFVKKIPGQISNRDAKRIAAHEDTGDGCGNCRYYSENRITGQGKCVLLKIRTNVICWCGQWEGKEDSGEA